MADVTYTGKFPKIITTAEILNKIKVIGKFKEDYKNIAFFMAVEAVGLEFTIRDIVIPNQYTNKWVLHGIFDKECDDYIGEVYDLGGRTVSVCGMGRKNSTPVFVDDDYKWFNGFMSKYLKTYIMCQVNDKGVVKFSIKHNAVRFDDIEVQTYDEFDTSEFELEIAKNVVFVDGYNAPQEFKEPTIADKANDFRKPVLLEENKTWKDVA